LKQQYSFDFAGAKTTAWSANSRYTTRTNGFGVAPAPYRLVESLPKELETNLPSISRLSGSWKRFSERCFRPLRRRGGRLSRPHFEHETDMKAIKVETTVDEAISRAIPRASTAPGPACGARCSPYEAAAGEKDHVRRVLDSPARASSWRQPLARGHGTGDRQEGRRWKAEVTARSATVRSPGISKIPSPFFGSQYPTLL
jgi:hypothetical protein